MVYSNKFFYHTKSVIYLLPLMASIFHVNFFSIKTNGSIRSKLTSLVAQTVKNLPAMQET